MRDSKDALRRHLSGKTGAGLHGDAMASAVEKMNEREAYALLLTIKNMELDARRHGRAEGSRQPGRFGR